MLRAALLLVVLLGSTHEAWAKDFISDVMVIGNNNETAFYNLQSSYEAQGWTAINKDLNAGCGDGTDYIHLLYKKQSSPGSSGTPITGFYIKTGSSSPESLTHEGRTYHLLPCNGSTNFVNSKGDLNRGAGGDYIHLYYTTDAMSNNHAVTDITFNDTQSGAVGKNGGTTGYDLNSGAGGQYIYMHVTTSNNVETLTSESKDVMLYNGNVLTGTGGKDTHVKIAAGATVTLSGVEITAIPSNKSHLWAGITCLGDAVIILDDGKMNNVKGGNSSSGIFVPEGYTLTIRGNGSLEAIGNYNSAGIGGCYKSSCGNIVIDGGNITAKGGSEGAGIGCGENGSCGNITINGGTITATGGYNSAGIGSGYYESSCGNIVIDGGNITAKGGSDGAGIGSSNGGSCSNITISGGTITATGGEYSAGIGSGNYNSSCGNISISSGNITATGGNYGAGIGSAENGSCSNITISGGTITATGGDYGAGIGNGYNNSSCGIITINGGDITATGGYWAAGIGTGWGGSCGDISISGGNITATGSEFSAGIGTGWKGSCGDITIGDNITRIISTMGDSCNTAIGPGKSGSCGAVTIASSLIDMTAGKTRTLWPGAADLVLYDNADNTTTISTYADSKKYDVQLRGRTLYRDGTWNTLCLPFDLSDFTGTLLEGFTAMELDTETARNGHVTGFDATDIAYHLNFKPATGIKAGKPYIVRQNTDSETGSITNPVFYGVTIKNVAPTSVASTDGVVTFKGSYSPVTLGANDHTKLFLGANNTLHHPNANMTVGSFHASFQLAISSKGDVNSDGGLSIGDVAAMVNYVMGTPNDHFVATNADLNGDGDINVTDVTLLVGMILNESQNLNIEVYSGDIPITYKGGGNGKAN